MKENILPHIILKFIIENICKMIKISYTLISGLKSNSSIRNITVLLKVHE